MRPITIAPVTIIFLAAFSFQSAAQTDDLKAGRITPKELSIPASPIFDLMGVATSQVTRTSNIKDFKVDWSLKSYKLNPNLAIQSQPIWEIFYNRKDLEKYQSASSFMRRLSSLDFSIGSVQYEDNDRRIGFAIKMNLFDRDPLMAKDLYTGISQKYRDQRTELQNQLRDLRLKLDTTKNILEKPGIRSEILSTEEQILSLHGKRREEINSRAKIFVDENWNASSLNVAFGKVFTYQTDSAGGLKNLRLNRNTAWGAWLNGSVGLGKKFLLSGLLRTTWYEEQVDFKLKNTTTQQESAQKAIADNSIYSLGLNLRYGGSIYTFFVEALVEQRKSKNPADILNEGFTMPGNSQLVTASMKWDVLNPNTISIGGDWRISQSVMLNYGMRCIFDSNWKFKIFTPLVTVSCMMR